jgi:uncharacterized protein YcbK (DUF882 family)
MPKFDKDASIVPQGHFTWAEFTYLRAFKIFAQPNDEQYHNALFLFSHLQPLRERLSAPLIITSGVRTPEYTEYLRRHGVPAARYSAHMTWQAVDLVCPNMTSYALWHFFDPLWAGRMEHWKDTPGWVHLDSRNWGQRLRFRA